MVKVKDNAPICLFVYNRLDSTKKVVTALQMNYLATESRLIIFSDAARSVLDIPKVQAVRDYIKTIDGFLSVDIVDSTINRGLAQSIIFGVTSIVNRYGKVIVLEDDLVTTPNFLSYMNQALDFYEDNLKIISVCAYGLKIKKPDYYNSDVYLYGRSSSWGWGTWKDRWNPVDWEIKDWASFKKNRKAIKAFNRNGSDMFKMLKSVTEGNGNSWAIRFGYEQFKKGTYSIMPFRSFVNNIGFSEEATNTKYKFSRFRTEMEDPNKFDFVFDKDVYPNPILEKECYSYHSLPIRIYSRIRYIIGF